MAHDVFGDDARNKEVEQIIAPAGFGSTAAHLESTKGMAADDSASAGAVHVNITGYELRFHTFDVGWAAREES